MSEAHLNPRAQLKEAREGGVPMEELVEVEEKENLEQIEKAKHEKKEAHMQHLRVRARTGRARRRRCGCACHGACAHIWGCCCASQDANIDCIERLWDEMFAEDADTPRLRQLTGVGEMLDEYREKYGGLAEALSTEASARHSLREVCGGCGTATLAMMPQTAGWRAPARRCRDVQTDKKHFNAAVTAAQQECETDSIRMITEYKKKIKTVRMRAARTCSRWWWWWWCGVRDVCAPRVCALAAAAGGARVPCIPRVQPRGADCAEGGVERAARVAHGARDVARGAGGGESVEAP